MSRFDDIDLVDVPDQWADIVRRAEAADLLELEPERSGRRRRRLAPAVAIAATVLAIGAVLGVGLSRLGDDAGVATTDTSVPDPGEDPPPKDPPPDDTAAAGEAPVLACPGAELLAGSIPADAVLGAESIWSVGDFAGIRPAMVTWSWTVDGMDVQLIVPGIPWTDFVGERTEALTGDLDGTLAYMWDKAFERETVNAIVRTGMSEPCSWAEVVVAGGTEAERVAVATAAARSLTWRTLQASPTAEEVVDESTVRQWSIDYAAEMLAPGAHVVEISITSYQSDEPIGRMVGPPTGPELAWSVILRTEPGALGVAGDAEGPGRELLLINFGSESKRWSVGVSPSFPAEQAMRDRENPVVALVVGRRTA